MEQLNRREGTKKNVNKNDNITMPQAVSSLYSSQGYPVSVEEMSTDPFQVHISSE